MMLGGYSQNAVFFSPVVTEPRALPARRHRHRTRTSAMLRTVEPSLADKKTPRPCPSFSPAPSPAPSFPFALHRSAEPSFHGCTHRRRLKPPRAYRRQPFSPPRRPRPPCRRNRPGLAAIDAAAHSSPTTAAARRAHARRRPSPSVLAVHAFAIRVSAAPSRAPLPSPSFPVPSCAKSPPLCASVPRSPPLPPCARPGHRSGPARGPVGSGVCPACEPAWADLEAGLKRENKIKIINNK